MAIIPNAVTAGTAPQKRMGFGEQLLLGLLSQAPSLVMNLMQMQNQKSLQQKAEARQAETDTGNQVAFAAAAPTLMAQGGPQADILRTLIGASPTAAGATGPGGVTMPAITSAPAIMRQRAMAISPQAGQAALQQGQLAESTATQIAQRKLAQSQEARAVAEEARTAQLFPWQLQRAETEAKRAALELELRQTTGPLEIKRIQSELRNNDLNYRHAFLQQAQSEQEQAANAARAFMTARGVQAGAGALGPDAAKAGAEMLQLWPMTSPSFDTDRLAALEQQVYENPKDTAALAEIQRMRGDQFGQALALSGLYEDPVERSALWQDELARLGDTEAAQRKFFAQQIAEINLAHGAIPTGPGKFQELRGDAKAAYQQDVLRLETALNIWRLLHDQRPVVFSNPEASKIAESALNTTLGGSFAEWQKKYQLGPGK